MQKIDTSVLIVSGVSDEMSELTSILTTQYAYVKSISALGDSFSSAQAIDDMHAKFFTVHSPHKVREEMRNKLPSYIFLLFDPTVDFALTAISSKKMNSFLEAGVSIFVLSPNDCPAYNEYQGHYVGASAYDEFIEDVIINQQDKINLRELFSKQVIANNSRGDDDRIIDIQLGLLHESASSSVHHFSDDNAISIGEFVSNIRITDNVINRYRSNPDLDGRFDIIAAVNASTGDVYVIRMNDCTVQNFIAYISHIRGYDYLGDSSVYVFKSSFSFLRSTIHSNHR